MAGARKLNQHIPLHVDPTDKSHLIGLRVFIDELRWHLFQIASKFRAPSNNGDQGMKLNARGALSLIAIAVLTACGGGSGSSSPGLVSGAPTGAPSAEGPDAPGAGQKENQNSSITVPYASDSELQAAMQVLDHARVDGETRTISAEVDDHQLEELRKLGLPVRIDEAETARIRKFVSGVSAGDSADKLEKISDGSNDHACYRTVESIYAKFDALAVRHPGLVKVTTVGKSFMGTQYDANDSTRSTFAKLMSKFLPASMLRTFKLDLLSPEPLPIKAIVVGNFARQDAQAQKAPNLVMTGGIHAREYAPQEAGMKYIEWLLDNYETDPNARMMVDSNRYHFIVHNPDGRKIAEQQASANHRKNADYRDAACPVSGSSSWTSSKHGGVDLNRNYPFGWTSNGAGASNDKCVQTTRGPSAASEPETQALLKYVRGTWNQSACKWEGGALPDGRPKNATYCNAENRSNGGSGELDWTTSADPQYDGGIYLDLHSYGGQIAWAWGVKRTENGNSVETPNHLPMTGIAQRMAYHSKNAAIQYLYDTEGTTDNAIYGFLGAPSYTVEMGNSFYQSCASFTTDVMPNNHKGIDYMSRILRRPYQMGLGPDTTGVTIAAASVPPGQAVAVTATVNDNSYRYSPPLTSTIQLPKPVVKNIKSAMAYIDKLPWEPGAVGIPLALSASPQADPALPKATQTATGSLDTTGLAPGRHMVYVQGVNDNDKAGAVSAAFLNIR